MIQRLNSFGHKSESTAWMILLESKRDSEQELYDVAT